MTSNMNEIRSIEIYSRKWYIAKDVCKILRLNNTTESLRPLSSVYKKIDNITSNSGDQKTNLIDINGIRQLLSRTRSIYKNEVIAQLGIEMDIIYECKESSYLRIITASFKHIPHVLQYNVDKYRIDLYFVSKKIAIEVDEFNHDKRNKVEETERQHYIEKKLGCTFIRFNPDDKNFNIGNVINEVLIKMTL